MSKKKPENLHHHEEEEFDPMVFGDEDFDEDDMVNTFAQVADASIEHMKVACDLTKIIVETRKAGELTADEILKIFKKSAETIMDCTPLKALFDKV